MSSEYAVHEGPARAGRKEWTGLAVLLLPLLFVAMFGQNLWLIVLLVALPISLQAHLVAGLVVVACMIVLKFFRAQGIWRIIALALGTAIVLRYVFWRTTSTIPPINEVANFIPAILLYIAEMYSVMMLFLSLFVVSSPMPSRKPPKVALPRS